MKKQDLKVKIVKLHFSDIDECLLETDECEDACINNVGSYTCECTDPGLMLGPDGLQCAGSSNDDNFGLLQLL